MVDQQLPATHLLKPPVKPVNGLAPRLISTEEQSNLNMTVISSVSAIVICPPKSANIGPEIDVDTNQ